MANPWITHVRDFAKKNGVTYSCALADPKVKDGYVKQSVSVKKPRAKKTV